ncbi:hypothetical protein [Desulfovibrio sp.]|uniref:hypothetical protein n=1 Tax=Desulfovibrio sp. TaxID=885 RepID=UPI0025B882B2|nr:hypothetical protein [Desulfovibrio sp.]
MNTDLELRHLWSLNSAGFGVCAGYLNCIFKQRQLGRPLTEEEIRAAHLEAEHLVNDEGEELYRSIFEEKLL